MSSPSSARPYVGVSGVVSFAQVLSLIWYFHDGNLNQRRRLLLGVKATHKTQWLDVENKYGPEWFPVGEAAFARAIQGTSADDVAGVAQVFLEPSVVADETYRDAFTARLLERGRDWLDGIQFDMLPWHTEAWAGDYLRALRAQGLDVYLQCHGPAMDELGPEGAARRLAELGDGVTHILFDASHGTGKRLDTANLSRFLDAAAAEPGLAHVGLAVAGGLDAEAVTTDLPALLESHPNLSWDAEGRLHPTVDGVKGRPLSMPVVAEYLRASADVLNTDPPADPNPGWFVSM